MRLFGKVENRMAGIFHNLPAYFGNLPDRLFSIFTEVLK